MVTELLTLAAAVAPVTDAATQADSSAVSQSASRAVVELASMVETVSLAAVGVLVDQLYQDGTLATVATLAGVDAATLAELVSVGLPAAEIPPLLVVATARDPRWRALGRTMQRFAATGRAGGRYSARGIEGS